MRMLRNLGIAAMGLGLAFAGPVHGAEKKAASGQKVDLNTATAKELEELPGVGPATAKKIIAGRPYAAVADLAKAGVPTKTITQITPLVTVSAPAASTPSAKSTPAPAPAPAAGASSGPASSVPAAAATPAQPPPAKGMVWVNTETKVYHREGDRWYGKTKHGKYMTESDAIAAGYRASREKEKKQP
jgi:hypothetical protein